MLCHCNKYPGRWWSPHLLRSSRSGETEAQPTKWVLAIALLQAGGWTTQPPGSLPGWHFHDSAGLHKHKVPAWQRCSAHIPFPLIVSSTLQTAAKETVSLHLSPSNQVLWAYMVLARHAPRLRMAKREAPEICNSVEVLGFPSEKKANSSSQLKQGLVQKVGVMSSDNGSQACLMCFASQNILIKSRIQPLGIQYYHSDLPCPRAVPAREAAESFHIRMLTEESWKIFLQQCKLWFWVPVWHFCCTFISLPRAELEGRGHVGSLI